MKSLSRLSMFGIKFITSKLSQRDKIGVILISSLSFILGWLFGTVLILISIQSHS